jgi:hypothetical protein
VSTFELDGENSHALDRFAVCEALAEELMVLGGGLAGTQPHWLTLHKPTPQLPWPLVQSLLQQQRVSTHVQTPIQNFLDTSTGSFEQRHRTPSETSRSRLSASGGTRVFVSTLPKTRSEVCLERMPSAFCASPILSQAEAREAAAMRPLSRSQHDGHPLAPAIAPGPGYKRTATSRPVAGDKKPVFVW